MANPTHAGLRSAGTRAAPIGAVSLPSAFATEGISSPSQRTENWSAALDLRTIGAALLVFAGYYLGAKIGFALTFQPHPISVLWPPNSILLAALLLAPPRSWWFLLLAAFPAHWIAQLQSQVPPSMVFCWFISNSCEALIGAGCVRYFISGPLRFDSLRNVGIFCLCGGLLGPFLSSFIDSAFVGLNHWGEGTYWEIWRIRFFSNALTALTLAPAIVTWFTDCKSLLKQSPRWRYLETAFLFLGLIGVSFAALYKGGPFADPVLFYAPLPFLLWAAVRLGSCGTTTAVLIVAFLGIWSAAHGHGPFSERSPEENARSIQMFLIVMSLPFLFLAALIEERAKVVETLREREERIGLAAESANLALWTINFQRRQSWMSDKGRDLFGFAPNEPLSREVFLSRVHPEDREAVDDAIERARAASQSFEIEYRLLRPDGETRWLIARGRYLRNDRGEVSELIGVAIDVTAQVKANIELQRQHQEMAHLGRVAVLGELTASLAHELNQPLTAIASNAAAGKRFLAEGSPDKKMLEELLADVFTDARRAGGVIHGIHDLVSKTEGTRRRVNLNEIIPEVLRLLHSDLVGRAITVDTELVENLPAVDADPVHLQQVVLNLIMNSIEAMHLTPAAQKRVVISTRCEANASVSTHVRDYGIGLPMNDPDKIFTQFYSTKRNGMGMGLSIVRSIVEAHGGELSAENCDVGARFSFRLPVATKLEKQEVA